MAVMLICPRGDGETELRGTIDVYYLTWCPACERLWRIELWSLLNADEPGRKLPLVIRALDALQYPHYPTPANGTEERHFSFSTQDQQTLDQLVWWAKALKAARDSDAEVAEIKAA